MSLVNPITAGALAPVPAPWDPKTQPLLCIGVHDEAPDVKTFTFGIEGGGYFAFLPGQFVTLELPVPDGPVYRTYTIASSPSRPFSIAVTVKAQAQSIGTRWMFDHLRRGGLIRASHGPLGQFTLAGLQARKYLFVSAGSGATPMMSMLRWLSDCDPEADVVYIGNGRRPEEIVFRAELELLATRMPNLTLGFLAENRSPAMPWSGLTGRIDGPKLYALVPDFRERTVFCCGPEPFMQTVSGLLENAGFDMSHYHQESFGPATVAEITPAVEVDSSAPLEGFMVKFAFSDAEVLCEDGQTLLQAARGAGVRIPAACESGLCGTCKVLKTFGTVEMNHNGGILDDEVADGYVLACCSRPLTAVTVEA